MKTTYQDRIVIRRAKGHGFATADGKTFTCTAAQLLDFAKACEQQGAVDLAIATLDSARRAAGEIAP